MASVYDVAPAQSVYVWCHLLQDRQWRCAFRLHLVRQLRPERALSLSLAEAKLQTLRPRSLSLQDAASVVERSIGGVLLASFACQTVHEAMLLLRYYAEAFHRKEACVRPTAASMEAYCEHINEHKTLILQAANDALQSSSGALADLFDYLWTTFNMRVKGDVAGYRQRITREMRETIGAAHFDHNDATVLLACLAHLFLPSLSYDQCLALAVGDGRAAQCAPDDDALCSARSCFVDVMLRFSVLWVDSATVNELVAFVSACVPAVLEAQSRIAQNGKTHVASMRGAAKGDAAAPASTTPSLGEGFHIRHLDVLGHRLRQTRYA